jgi:hypothetical protein
LIESLLDLKSSITGIFHTIVANKTVITKVIGLPYVQGIFNTHNQIINQITGIKTIKKNT